MLARSTDIRAALRSRQRGFLLNPFRFGGGGGGGDPDFANVVALLHMDGPDAGTTFTDNSSSAKTWTPNGGTSLSTAQKKFGSASARFIGSHNSTASQYSLSTPDHPDFDFGSGNFTLEAQAYYSSLPTNFAIAHGLFSKRASTAVYSPFIVELALVSGGARFRAQVSTTGSSWITITGTTNRTVGVFYHVALVRDGTNLRLFVNGVQDGPTATVSGALMTNSAAVHIGAASAARDYSMDGYVDEVRITKGVARYTANFTPPAAAFPNS